MLASDAASAAATWRPAQFGNKRARTIDNPIVEPLWTGPRVLAFVDRGKVRLTDIEGSLIEGHDELAAALADAAQGETLLVEAFLTPEPLRAPALLATDAVSAPKLADVVTQMVVGSHGQRTERLADRQDEARRRTVEGASHEAALVAVDLLWLDDQSLCDVPLLERKRILESVIAQSELVRVGIHITPPIDTWLGSWRSFGLRRISFKAANSRYVPG
jgi:hypothetical protein